MRFFGCTRYASYLTNGVDYIPIEYSRFSCGITPLPGMIVSYLNGRQYINGKSVWIEIKEEND